jgi:hypothetical protein
VDREIGITVYAFDKTMAIKLGFEDYASKYGRLQNVLGYLRTRSDNSDLSSIDLINLDRIVINPVRTESPGANHKEV